VSQETGQIPIIWVLPASREGWTAPQLNHTWLSLFPYIIAPEE